MHRIDTATTVNALPAPAAVGMPGYFTDGNPGPGTPVPATNFDNDWCNAIQEEIVALATAAGDALDKTNQGQALAALKKLLQLAAGNYAVDTGANGLHYVAALTPAPANQAALVGVRIRVKLLHTCVASPDLNMNGFGAHPIVRPPGGSVFGSDMGGTGIYTFVWDGTNYQCQELAPLGVMGSAIWPQVVVPNDGAAHTIATVGQTNNTNFGSFAIELDDAGGNVYSASLTCQAGAALTPGSTSTLGAPGTNTFSMSGTNLQLTRSGGPANLNVNPRQLSA